MNEFSKTFDVVESKKPEAEYFKDIKPERDMSVKEAKSFVDRLFENSREQDGDIYTENDVPSEKNDISEENKEGGRFVELINREGTERHHMPADCVNGLERDDGPAIIMDKDDHRQTASCGGSKEAKEYQIEQAKLVGEGKLREAFQMDVDDIRSKFGEKYDDAIAQADKYISKLETEGKI